MGSKSAGPGMEDVPAFDMPPTQPIPWNVNNLMGGGPNNPPGMPPFAGGQPIPPGMAPPMGGMSTNFGFGPQMSPDNTLNMLYQTQLGRQGDQGGMDYWRQQMAGGMTPDQVADMMARSNEGQAFRQNWNDRRRQQQMSPEVLDAMRLAYERNRPQRTYTPEEWSATFGPNVEPDPRMIRQEPTGQLPPNVGQALALLGRLGLGG